MAKETKTNEPAPSAPAAPAPAPSGGPVLITGGEALANAQQAAASALPSAGERNPYALPAEQQLQAPEPKRHRAEKIENSDGVAFRAPMGVHVRDLGAIVHGNFHGHHEGKSWRVLHGCPVNGVPGAILDKICASDPKAIAPWEPPPSNVVR